VEILFASRRLEKLCNSSRDRVKALGDQRAKVLGRRLDQLRAAETLEVLRTLPGRCHELLGDRKGQLSMDLDGPYRLLFEPVHDPAPRRQDGGLAWDRVTAIRILEVEDTHG
jgi:plasmid maintenance system killer protein